MTVLVLGGRGVLGRRVAAHLRSAGHEVRTAGRANADVLVDLSTGAGLSAALESVEAVFHCATDPRRHRSVDRDGTARLVSAASVPVIFPSIVGCDVIPLGYYRSKLEAEATVLSHAPGGIVVRATQFHQLIWTFLDRLSRLPAIVVPHDTRFQVLDPDVVAETMVGAAEGEAIGRLDDLGGPFAYGAKELARSYLAASGIRRPVFALNAPGVVGAAFRAGGNLTENRAESGESWNEFVRRRTQ